MGEISNCTMGVYDAYIQVNVSDNYTVTIAFNNVQISNSPLFGVEWIYGNVSARYSFAFGGGVFSDSIVAGFNATFHVVSYNLYGLAIPVCPMSAWSVMIDPEISRYPQNLNYGQTNCSNGVATLQYNATTAGDYEVRVSLDGLEILMSPYNVTVIPTAIDLGETILLNRTGTDSGTFYLQIRDRFGNDETNLTHNRFDVSLVPYCTNTTISTKSVGGYLECNYTAQAGGTYCVALYSYTLGAFVPIENSTFTIVGGLGCTGSCSYQGYCISSNGTYSCNCMDGYIEDDCGTKRSSKYPLAVGAVVGLIVGLAVLLFIIGLVLGWCVLGRLRKKSNNNDGDDNKPLLSAD
jgi:hypothetical protein